MKKYFSLAVIALAVTLVGCTGYVDNGSNGDVVLDGGTTTLTLSISDPISKVTLGDKAENGIYSVYWNEDDQISINGTSSVKIFINSDNQSAASFDFGSTLLQTPYKILYPASTNDNVIFVATQNYCEGSFEPGTAPFYGYMERGLSGKLSHLGGVLRFGVVGASENVALKDMIITAETGSITGAFAVDFSNGKLTALDGASSTLHYSFGQGLNLSTTEAKNFFVVLPAGEFGICSAELHTTDNQKMIMRFKTSGTSAVKAGIVREFREVIFRHGEQCTLTPLSNEEDEFVIDNTQYIQAPTTVDGDYLVINDIKELLWLFYMGQRVDGVVYNKIRIGADIEMGKYSYVNPPAMKLDANTEIDGNNKTITGINLAKDASSIFGDANNLNIHDLTLTDCSVNTTLQTGAGILVGKVSEGLTVNNVTFNNCSVVAPCKIGLVAGALHTGTFNISNVTANGGLVETSYVSGKSGLAGGLVGCVAKDGDGATVSTTTFTNCTVSTTVKSYMEATNTFYGKIVGQFGGYNGNEKLYFVNCSGADATLVPLYDKGNKHAKTAVLSICEEHRADFCSTILTSATDNILGGERLCRGEIYFDGNRFVYEWDGKRTATMLTEVVDGITVNYIYSAFDIAKAQSTSFDSTKKVVFKTDVDLGGHAFKPINYICDLDGENHSIYNLKIDITQNASKNYGAGFMVYSSSNATVHKDLTFVGADISCKHDDTIAPLEYGNEEDGGAGNAYAGVLISRTLGNNNPYTVSNVHVVNSKVKGVCKVGGLIGNMTNTKTGAITIDNCSVDNSIIENYDPKVVNYYGMFMEKNVALLGDLVVEAVQWWYTAGECGGLIGFVSAKNATISNCSVTNTQINCTGQENKTVVANIWNKSAYEAQTTPYTNGQKIQGGAKTTIAGRHINQFIGDIRSQRSESQQKNGSGEYTTIISNYTVSGNSYNGVSADSTNDYNHNYASGSYCPVVGCAYYTGVDLKISFLITIELHFQHCAGTLTFNEKGGSETTLIENLGSGNNLSWFGGDSSDISISSYTSYYPAAPTE